MSFQNFTTTDWYGYGGAEEDAMMWHGGGDFDMIYEPGLKTLSVHSYSDNGPGMCHVKSPLTLDEATVIAQLIVTKGPSYDFSSFESHET